PANWSSSVNVLPQWPQANVMLITHSRWSKADCRKEPNIGPFDGGSVDEHELIQVQQHVAEIDQRGSLGGGRPLGHGDRQDEGAGGSAEMLGLRSEESHGPGSFVRVGLSAECQLVATRHQILEVGSIRRLRVDPPGEGTGL